MRSNSGFLRRAAIFVAAFFVFSLFWQAHARAFFLGGVSLKDEKEMGRKFDVMIRSHIPVVEDPEVANYVEGVLKRLVKAIPPQPFEFKSSVVLHNALNAFAVPGGYVFVFSGMLMNLNSEDELAGVLAHELAHVTQRHVASRMERAQALTLGTLILAVAGIALGGPAGAAAAITATAGGQAAMLNYSRVDESEADNLGLQYLIAAGYPATGMVGGFKILRQKTWMSGINVPTYLSTHPAIGDRINSLSTRIAARPAKASGKVDNRAFQRVKTLMWARYGDSQAALRLFAKNDPLSLLGRGITLARLNRVAEADKAFDAALLSAPADPLISREAGIFHFRKGNMAKAEELLLKAMRADRHDYMAAFFYGRLLDETGRQKKAPGYYREVLRQVPQNSEVHEAFARSLGKAGDNYLAYVHKTYGALYANNKKQAERYFKQAQGLAKQASDKKPFQRLESAYKERKEIWEKS